MTRLVDEEKGVDNYSSWTNNPDLQFSTLTID